MAPITVATIAPWQHSSPGGGLLSTSWMNERQLLPGMVVRYEGGWAALITVAHSMSKCWPAVRITVRTADGVDHPQFTLSGFEVRDDMRWDYAPIARCGCWQTIGGTWTCDTHLRRRRLKREATRRPRSSPNRPLRWLRHQEMIHA